MKVSAPTLSAPPIPEELRALAPLQLVNHRSLRYQGDNLFVSLDELAARDQTLLHRLYERLSDLLLLLVDTSTSDVRKWDELEQWAERQGLDDLVDEVREIGVASLTRAPSETLAMTIHDVRGGALSSLIGRLQLLGYLRTQPGALNAFFVQTRDHLKIMRNALTGLDEPRREADRTPKAHAMRLMMEKWQGAVIGPQWDERSLRMSIDCRYEGPLTECCLESAAIDRIFYNLANNASRHAADDSLEMAVFPLPEPSSGILRMVLSNRVGEMDKAMLRALEHEGADSTDLGTGRSLFMLFEPQVSSSGSGYGLTVVADFVAGAFGLEGRTQALRERYVGAVLEGDTFRVWFHWPIARGDLPPKMDDYRHPRQSLSEPP